VEEQLGPDGVALMCRIKNTLDPHGTLNPGKKVPPSPGVEAAAPPVATLASA